jgi:hypothetical protein
MSTPHYLVFIGPTPSLSTELLKLSFESKEIQMVAPAARKHDKGASERAIQDALSSLKAALARDDRHREAARLSVWTFEPEREVQFETLWRAFGTAAWIELVPARLRDQDRLTRLYIQDRIRDVNPLIHLVASEVSGHRKTSPLPLPFQNFKSKAIGELTKQHWYAGMALSSFKVALEKTHQRFREMHTSADRKHYDDRSLGFSPAANTECHGQSHPMGSCDRCFVGGRFRFGAALFPGFHYDVSTAAGRLNCTLFDCEGVARDLWPERRTYINIFPNDYLLPAK